MQLRWWVFFWQHVQHVCTTNLCVYDTFNHQLARLPTFGNLCHFVNCRTTPSQPQMTTPWIRMILLCNSSVYTRTNRTNALKHFYSWSAKLCPRTNTKTHTQHIHTYSYIQWTHFVHVKQLRHNKNVCLWANFIWSVCITKSFVCVCIFCKDMSIFVCVHVYIYVWTWMESFWFI